MKVVVNRCFGGFGLSTAAYEKLAEWGVPIRQYQPEERGPDGLFVRNEANQGEVIFDRDLTPASEDSMAALYWKHRASGENRVLRRYWDTWTRETRNHPLVVRVVEELGEAANGPCAELEVVEIPDDIDWHIDEYDGQETVHENHRTW